MRPSLDLCLYLIHVFTHVVMAADIDPDIETVVGDVFCFTVLWYFTDLLVTLVHRT